MTPPGEEIDQPATAQDAGRIGQQDHDTEIESSLTLRQVEHSLQIGRRPGKKCKQFQGQQTEAEEMRRKRRAMAPNVAEHLADGIALSRPPIAGIDHTGTLWVSDREIEHQRHQNTGQTDNEEGALPGFDGADYRQIQPAENFQPFDDRKAPMEYTPRARPSLDLGKESVMME